MKNNYPFFAWLYKLLENPKIFDLSAKVLSFNNKRIDKYLPELVKPQSASRILDVGCGTGRYADAFHCEYFGVDPNEEYIKYAKSHHQGNFSIMDGEDLEFPDNTFDFVLNISVLHHLPDNLVVKMIAGMKRVCKKGGKIFVIEAVYPRKINLWGYLAFKFDRGRHQRTFEQLRDFLCKYGFEVITDDLGKAFTGRWAVFSYKNNFKNT